MRLVITVDIFPEESGLNPDDIKDDIISFVRDLLINGAEEQDVALSLKEVEYES